MAGNTNRPTVYGLTLTLRDKARIAALEAALSRQAGCPIGPTKALRWAITHAETLLGIQPTGPGTASAVGSPLDERT